MRRRSFLIGVGALALVRCGDSGTSRATATAGARAPTQRAPSPSPTSMPSPTATFAPRLAAPGGVPAGFPVNPSTVTGVVVGSPGSRAIRWGEGAPAGAYSRVDQPSDDPERANRCGWNAQTHVAYEGQPAVDWYLPPGTPVRATLDGTATLLVNTVSNPFDVYGVSREPYIGNPDRAHAPVVPFPGPGGGQGVFVRVENATFRADFAHLDIVRTLTVVPPDAYLAGYSATTLYATRFARLRDYTMATAVARWPVRRGDALGLTGDSGYSEAPHLHYAIAHAGSSTLLCPTLEPGFTDSGWLFL